MITIVWVNIQTLVVLTFGSLFGDPEDLWSWWSWDESDDELSFCWLFPGLLFVPLSWLLLVLFTINKWLASDDVGDEWPDDDVLR